MCQCWDCSATGLIKGIKLLCMFPIELWICKACCSLFESLKATEAFFLRFWMVLLSLPSVCSISRAHMRKGRTLRRTAVKGAGQHKRVLVEQTDNSRKGPKALWSPAATPPALSPLLRARKRGQWWGQKRRTKSRRISYTLQHSPGCSPHWSPRWSYA